MQPWPPGYIELSNRTEIHVCNDEALLQGAGALPLGLFARSGLAAEPVGTPFSADTVREAARDLASRPFQPQETGLPGYLANISYDQYRSLRFKQGPRAVARYEGALAGRVLPSRVDLQGPGRCERGGGRAQQPGSLQPRPVQFRRFAAADQRGSGVCRVPLARADQPSGLLRRGVRLSRSELLPGGSEGARLWAVGARPGD